MTEVSGKFTPWSISKAQVANNCTLRFNLQYIEKAKQQRIERPEGRIGAAAHEFVEDCLEGKDYREAYKKAVVSNRLTREETLELATYKDAVLGFVKRFTAWRDKMGVSVDDFFIEKDVAFDRDRNITEYWGKDSFFRGKWDIGALVRRGGKLYVIIMDHKTGEPKDDLERYKDQLWSYVASAKVLYPDLAGAQTAIHWMKADDPKKAIVWGKMMSAEKIESEVMPWFWDFFAEAGEKGQGVPVPTQGWFCDFCGFKYRCPLYRK